MRQHGILDAANFKDGCPNGWEEIHHDLNTKCKGDTIKMCVRRGESDRGLTSIRIAKGHNAYCENKHGYNMKAGTGKQRPDLFLCRNYGGPPFLKDVKIVNGHHVPAGYNKDPQDIRQGCGGDYLFLTSKGYSMDELCQEDRYIWHDRCNQTCQVNNSVCWNKRKAYCTNPRNITKQVCRQWCTENKGVCDEAAKTYCNASLNDNNFCGCFEKNALNALPEEARKHPQVAQSKAVCFSKNCNEGAYLTATMDILKDTCPACIQSINFADIDVKNGDILLQNINQSCDVKKDTNTPPQTTPPQTTSATTADTRQSTQKVQAKEDKTGGSMLMYVFIALLIIFLSSSSSAAAVFLI